MRSNTGPSRSARCEGGRAGDRVRARGQVFPRNDGAGGSFEAVRDLSFTVRRGELLAILGRTGCGKSTTFNLIAGLLRPSSGAVRVKGHDPFAEFDWFRGRIGIVFQNDRLMPWRTAFENVELGLELNKVDKMKRAEVVQSWLERLGLAGHEHDFPHALSGGMRQRVSIARAFATRPRSFCATSRSRRWTSTPETRCATNSAPCSQKPAQLRSSSPIPSRRPSPSAAASWCSNGRRGSPMRRGFTLL